MRPATLYNYLLKNVILYFDSDFSLRHVGISIFFLIERHSKAKKIKLKSDGVVSHKIQQGKKKRKFGADSAGYTGPLALNGSTTHHTS